MSYSIEEFFMDNVGPKIAELFANEVNYDTYEKFMQIIREALDGGVRRSDTFKRDLLNLVIEPYQKKISPNESMKKIFYELFDEMELISLKYREEGATVSVEYLQEDENKDL